MIWLDFFLQTFLHALAWCLAFMFSAGVVGWLMWSAVQVILGNDR